MFSVLVLLSFPTFNIYKKFMESAENKESALNELESLEQRNNELSGRLERFKTERGLEEEIRKKFNVAKEGEGVVVIVPGTSTTTGIPTKEKGLVAKFLEFLEKL